MSLAAIERPIVELKLDSRWYLSINIVSCKLHDDRAVAVGTVQEEAAVVFLAVHDVPLKLQKSSHVSSRVPERCCSTI